MRKISAECCCSLIKAIDDYISKADDKLKKKLKKQGFVDVDETLSTSEKLEAELIDEKVAETTSVLDGMADCDTLEEFYEDVWPSIKAEQSASRTISTSIETNLGSLVPKLTNSYIAQVEPDLPTTSLSARTNSWIKSWSSQLGEMMKLDSVEELENIFLEGIDEGIGIEAIAQRIKASGIREEYYQARRTALTEVLRGNSVAQQEAYEQSPVVSGKTWKHGGAAHPRENHLAMNGVTVPVDKPFDLMGADGVMYHPMYPRDALLPPGESISCHCIVGPSVDEDILGMSREERLKMREEALAEIDSEWEKSLDDENKAKAGINEDTVRLDWIKQKDKAGQIKYLGSKSRWALVESGVVTKDSDLFKTITSKTGSITVKKTLKELSNDGIITVHKHKGRKGKTVLTLHHSTKGDFSGIANPNKPPGGKNGGNLVNGGHSQTNIDYLESKGIGYEIKKTYSNGVRIGGVANHTNSDKVLGTYGQAWFPETWTDDDVLLAGTHTANTNPKVRNDFVFSEYKGVRVGVFIDGDGNINTIFPDNSKQPWKGGWETTNVNT